MPKKYIPESKRVLKLDSAERAKKAKIQLARQSLRHFVEYVFRTEGGDTVEAADHQIAWEEHIRYCWNIGKFCGIVSPMTFAKTAWIAIALPLWLIGKNPNLRIMIVSSAEDVAAKRLQDIQRYIENSPEYHEVFPEVRPDYTRQWNNQAANVIRYGKDGGFVGSIDHSISAFGYTAKAGNGARADVIIFDDVASESNSSSEAQRNELMRLVTNQWLTRTSKIAVKDTSGNVLCNYSMVVFIGTRYHQSDIYSQLLFNNQMGYCSLVQAVSSDFRYLDLMVLGSLVEPAHPVWKIWKDYDPNKELAEEAVAA